MAGQTSFNLMAILDELEPLDASARESRLSQLALDAAQLAQVRAGLSMPTKASSFLEQPVANLTMAESLPTQIGQFRIVRLIGTGGMGAVYEAEQDRPRRRVALKVIRPGYLSPSMQRRFEYEADVLARLEHPGIARIYEAGVAHTNLGTQPFFAMEFVDGQRVDEFIRRQDLPRQKRLELLVRICQAVHHAHTKGIVHRDLKPANILITADGSPKILDFGVARAIDSDIQATTMHTESGQLVGTLPYMSPEQAAGRINDIDTTSDVYALGVVAYQILSGKMPYRLDDKPLHEAVQIICEAEPSRLSSVDRNLRGDIETIVGKALAKEKTRRYPTAGEFAADVKRFLDYQPITARPPSTWYQFSKFAKRNKVLVTIVAAALLGLGALSIVLAVAFFRERELRVQLAERTEQAEESQKDTDRITQFLTNDVLLRATADNLPEKYVRDALLKAVIDPASERVEEQFKDKPLIEARVRTTLADVYHSIGSTAQALPQAKRALEVRRKLLGDDNPETLVSMSDVAGLLRERGDYTGAKTMLAQALASSRRVLGDDHRSTLRTMINYGNLLQYEGKPAEAEPIHREAVERLTRVVGPDHPDTLSAMNSLGGDLQHQGKLPEAEVIFREALKRRLKIASEKEPSTLMLMQNLATVLNDQQKLEEAEKLSRQSMEGMRAVLGEDHALTLTSMNNLGKILMDAQRYPEAEALLRESLERKQRVIGPEHPEIIPSLKNLGLVRWRMKKYSDAEEPLRQALALQRKYRGEDHGQTLDTQSTLASVLAAQGKRDEAEVLVRDWLERTRRSSPNDKTPLVFPLHKLCNLLVDQQRYADADPYLREWLDVLRAIGSGNSAAARSVVGTLVTVCEKTKRPEEAAQWRSELERMQAAPGAPTRPATAPMAP